jgi:hypothetical protein
MSAGRGDRGRGDRGRGDPGAPSFDDIPFDNHLMIWRYVQELERPERYRARAMDYVYLGHVRTHDREHLWRIVRRLLDSPILTMGITGEQAVHDARSALLRAHDARPAVLLFALEDRLRSVVTRLFVPLADTREEMNLTGPAWTHIAFHLLRLIPDDRTVAGVSLQTPERTFRRVGAVFRSADGLHTISLNMMWAVENAPRPQIIQIRYRGPQRFHTLEHPDRDADHRVADVGYLMEAREHLSPRQ